MNILIPHTWLLEHLETDADPATIQRLLSLSGPSVERIHDREAESVYDIEVTTNRVDSMSVRGIAREAAVILQQAGIDATLKPLSFDKVRDAAQTVYESSDLPLPKIINDPRLCKRTICIILSNVQHSQTPDWMAKRLRQIEQNVHDSVIDITNYITHELGHPCHAFDYDKIMAHGGEIIVKEAVAGKTFITLDGAEYETKGGEIVFENQHGEIIDLPAIKGTANTAVDDQTKNVLFWIESLNAKKVRHASMQHAIRTVAAQLNEKNVDPYLAEPTLLRGMELYQQLCNADFASPIHDEFPSPPQPKPVVASMEKIAEYLGLELPVEQLVSILQSLECVVSIEGNTLAVTPPTFRPDIKIDVDVIEEVARMYGYHNLPSRLMATALPTTRPTSTDFHLEAQAKRFLAARGCQELYTYSLVSEQLAQEDHALASHLKLQNPLTDDHFYLRQSLIPSLCQALNENPMRPELTVFELANIYLPAQNSQPTEELHLTLVSGKPYRQLRADAEALATTLHITNFEVTVAESGADTGVITAEKNGEIHEIGRAVSLPKERFAFDFNWQKLIIVRSTHPTYRPIAKSAPLTEDLTLTLPPKTAIGPLVDAFKTVSPLLSSIELIDQYRANFTFRFTYSDPQESISSEQVAPVRKALVRTAHEHGGELVGTLAL